MPELDRLQLVELRDIWPNEAADFTPWLTKEENLALLGETLGMGLELETQEIDVGDFQTGILCRDTVDSSRVLIESQLESTDHSHLGQILTYAAGFDAHTVIWIAKEFREEHCAALDRLNEITNENFQYFGIEVKVWQIGDSARAPQFEIVSSPDDWIPTVKRDTQPAASGEFSETQQQKKFWTALRDYMVQKDSPIKWQTPGHWRDQTFSIGRTNFGLFTRRNPKDRFIATALFMGGVDAKKHFDLLKKHQQEIEREFGEPLEWEKRIENKESRISLHKRGTDPTDEADWSNQHEWFASKLELFDKVFRPRIKALNADDWEPFEDEDDE